MTVSDVTFAHPDLIGASDAVILAFDRIAVASPLSGRVLELRFDEAFSMIMIEDQTAVLTPPPTFVNRREDYLYILCEWTPQDNGRLSMFLVDAPNVEINVVNDHEMGGALLARNDVSAVFHARTKTTGMLVARDPVTLAELDAIVIGGYAKSIFIDENDPSTLYVMLTTGRTLLTVGWDGVRLTIVNKTQLPAGFNPTDIMAFDGLLFYLTSETYCIYDPATDEMTFSYHEALQEFGSVLAVDTDLSDVSAEYLLGIQKAKRSVDRSRQFRDPNMRRHFLGRFAQMIGTQQAPFAYLTRADPQPLLRRLSARNIAFDATTGILTWAGVECFRFRGWAGVGDAEVMQDDDVTALTGDIVSYDDATGVRVQWVGAPTWGLDPGEPFSYRCLTFDGSTYGYTDNRLSGRTLDQFSVLAWVKPTGVPQPMTVAAYRTAENVGWELRIAPVTTGLKIELWVNGQLYARSSGTIVLYDGDWHQVGAVLTATDTELYYDGVLHDTIPIPPPILILPPPAYAPFVGLIADVRVYTDERTQAYILGLFADGPRG